MSHFAVIAPTYPSHFSALQALAVALVERGHRVSFVQQPGAERWLDDPRIGYVGLGPDRDGAARLHRMQQLAGRTDNPWHLHRLIRQMAANSALLCERLPAVLKCEQVDALLCDQMAPAGAIVAEAMGLPFMSVACALPVNREPGVPLPVLGHGYGLSPDDLRLQQGTERVHDWFMAPLSRVLQRACQHYRLPPRRGLHQFLSPLLQLSQTPANFDFPRQQLPAHYHALGPLRSERTSPPGPWPLDPRRPLVFASLGTLQGHRAGLFKRIAKACRQQEAQLLVAHCGGLGAARQAELLRCGATFVTDFAPQQWAVQQADVVVSHGGLNTVLDAAVAGTPQLVLPIAFDQPGVAARVVHHRLGLRLSRRAGVGDIATALAQLLRPAPGLFAPLQPCPANGDAARRGALLIEQALLSGRAVPREDAPCRMT